MPRRAGVLARTIMEREPDRRPWDRAAGVLSAPSCGGCASPMRAELAVGGGRVRGGVGMGWAGPAEAGLTLGYPLALVDQVETQACTREQNRICTCKPGWYCTLRRQEGCRLCAPLRRCRPGFGVAKPGMGPGPAVLGGPRGPLLHGCQPVSPTWEHGQWRPGAGHPYPFRSLRQHARLGAYCVLGLEGSREGSD